MRRSSACVKLSLARSINRSSAEGAGCGAASAASSSSSSGSGFRLAFGLKNGAAFGLAQLEVLDDYNTRRKEIFGRIDKFMRDSKMEQFFILPKSYAKCVPSWFGYPLTLKPLTPLMTTDFPSMRIFAPMRFSSLTWPVRDS